MGEEPTKTPRRLRWWFWFLLFAPAVVNVSGLSLPGVVTMHPGEHNWFSNFVLSVLFLVNLVSSLAAAACLERAFYGRLSVWIIPVGSAFFFLNLVLSFGGCMAGAYLFQ